MTVTGGTDYGLATGLQSQNGAGTGGSASKPAGIASAGQPTLQVTCNGQTVAANSSTCFISAQPAFPQLVASLVPAAGQALSGNVQWTLVAVYDSPEYPVKDPNTGVVTWYYWEYTYTTGPITLPATSSWTVANYVAQLYGGAAKLSYTGSYSGSISFNILGNPNPFVSTVQSALAAYPWRPSLPWYLFQLVNQESSYKQFNTGTVNRYLPNWGTPQGFGLMQVDLLFWPDSYQVLIWDWTQNVTLGSGILQGDITSANNFWLTQQNSFNAYNSLAAQHGAQPAPPPWDVTEGGPPGGGCLFSYNLGEAGAHPFSDAIAMKYYNAGAGSPYLQFVGPSSPTSYDAHWAYSQTGGNLTDYPELVCSKTQGN